MEAIVAGALSIISATGPIGSILAGIVVALVIGIIIFAHTQGLFSTARTDRQNTDFQDRLIKLVDKLTESGDHLRIECERLEAENDGLKDRIREMLTATDLLRVQLRRYIETLQAVKEGRLAPAAIRELEAGELAETAA